MLSAKIVSALALLLFCVQLAAAPVQAAAPTVDTHRQILQKEREALERIVRDNQEARKHQRRRIEQLTPETVTPLMVERAAIETEEARVALRKAEVDLQATRYQVGELQASVREQEERIQQLKMGKADGRVAELEAALAEKRGLHGLEEERAGLRETAVAAAAERLSRAREWQSTVESRHRAAVEHSRKSALDRMAAEMEAEERRWLSQAAEWRKELQALDPAASSPRHFLLQARIQEAEERARLALQNLRFAQMEARLEQIEGTDTPGEDTAVLKSALQQAEAARSELTASRSLLRKRLDVLRQQLEVLDKRSAAGEPAASQEERRVYLRVEKSLQGQVNRADELHQRVDARVQRLQAAWEHSSRIGLTARRPLPTDPAGWAQLQQELSELPSVLIGRLSDSVRGLVQPLTGFSPDRWLLLFMAMSAWFVFASRLRRSLARANPAPGDFLADLKAIPLLLARRSSLGLAAFGALAILYGFTQPVEPSATMVTALLATWGGASVLVNLAWALLMSSELPESRRNPRLYRQLKWMLLTVAGLVFVNAAAAALALSTPLNHLLNRALMFSLLLFTLPAFEARRLGLQALERQFGERHWMGVVRIISLLAPVSVLAAASVGVAGFVNLAKAIGSLLALCLAVLAAWLLLARLLREGVDAAKNWVNLHTGHGLLLTKGVIEPLHTVLRPVLFLAFWSIPFQVYGVGLDAPVIRTLVRALSAPLVTFGTTSVNLIGIAAAVFGLVAVVRLGRWLRLMTYRWAFSGITDEGIRNSLSVFTQYAVVVVGLLLTLHLIGIDLTTLAIFAGALGVGIGFGLQNIANNFISGILLLVERPLRTNDIVKVGEHEGQVTHIGMRSITVKTWDNQEVIMPNADVISNAFTNWTHHDHIVRTVLEIRVGYETDPQRAKPIVEGIVGAHPAVLADPEPHVWLREFGDYGLVFHTQYFTDLTRSNRLDTRSEILMGIWEALRQEGIRIPHPRMEIRWQDEGIPPPARMHPAQSNPEQLPMGPSSH